MRSRFDLAVCCILALLTLQCVPSPSENANVPPRFVNLRAFYMRDTSIVSYHWHHTIRATGTDSVYLVEYIGKSDSTSFDGLAPISLFRYSDTIRKNYRLEKFYLSDSQVIHYFSDPLNSMDPRQILLHDTLRVGGAWHATDAFRTRNGAKVSIKSLVEDYYAELYSAGKLYDDVFRISYISTVTGPLNPEEIEYQDKSRLVIYFARGVGEIIKQCKDLNDSLIWSDELLETRIR